MLMYYINAKQQKKKEEIHHFYAFPQIFYKKFTTSAIIHSSQNNVPASSGLLLPVLTLNSVPEQLFQQKMSDSARRPSVCVLLCKCRAAAQPDSYIKERPVSGYKFFLVGSMQYGKDTVRLRPVNVVDHIFLPCLLRIQNRMSANPGSPGSFSGVSPLSSGIPLLTEQAHKYFSVFSQDT